MLTDLQKALGEGPLIANHAYGPPHDPMEAGSVSFSMIEGFGANNASIQQLLMNAENGRGVVAHGRGSEDDLAAFLIGAYHRAYYGLGGWSEGKHDFNNHWLPQFALPLGEPLSDATYDASGGTWNRQFAHGVNVTFAVKINRGKIVGWNFPPSPPPLPPTPLPNATKECPEIVAGGFSGDDLAETTEQTWGSCCAACGARVGCAHWTWGHANAPRYCHLHGPRAAHNGDTGSGRISGTAVHGR